MVAKTIPLNSESQIIQDLFDILKHRTIKLIKKETISNVSQKIDFRVVHRYIPKQAIVKGRDLKIPKINIRNNE